MVPHQAGLEGLHDGLRRYEPARGARLGTCLYFSIRNCVVKESRRQNRVVIVPGNAQRQQEKLQEALTAFVDHHSRYVDPHFATGGQLQCLSWLSVEIGCALLKSTV